MSIIIIDGKTVECEENATILEAASAEKIHIPTLCYWNKFNCNSLCGICVVENVESGELVRSCSTKVDEGKHFNTKSEKVKKARMFLIEMLKQRHNDDCTTCCKPGECELMSLIKKHGEIKKTNSKDFKKIETENLINISSNIVLDRSRCILCGRCQKYSEKFAFEGRGVKRKISFVDKQQSTNDYNLIDLCPVGAFCELNPKYPNKYFELESKNVKCIYCEKNCDILLRTHNGKFHSFASKKNGDSFICEHVRDKLSFLNDELRITFPIAIKEQGKNIEKLSEFCFKIPSQVKIYADTNFENLHINQTYSILKQYSESGSDELIISYTNNYELFKKMKKKNKGLRVGVGYFTKLDIYYFDYIIPAATEYEVLGLIKNSYELKKMQEIVDSVLGNA